jgi:hypothetical protein
MLHCKNLTHLQRFFYLNDSMVFALLITPDSVAFALVLKVCR